MCKQKIKTLDDLTLYNYIELFLRDEIWTYCGTIFELDRQGDYAGALPYYERALAIRQQVLGRAIPPPPKV